MTRARPRVESHPATRYLRAQILSEIAASVDHNDMRLGVELMVPLGETA